MNLYEWYRKKYERNRSNHINMEQNLSNIYVGYNTIKMSTEISEN